MVLAGLLSFAAPAWAGASTDGIEATIRNVFDFEMRLEKVVFRVKAKPGTGNQPELLDYVPLKDDRGGRVNLWLSQIDTVTIMPRGRTCRVKATLQGDGATVEGEVVDASRCYFEGRVLKGVRKGARAKFAVRDVQTLKNHTEGRPSLVAVGKLLPMPGLKDDVLYVSSVPIGAEVYVKAFEGPAKSTWRSYRSLGKTPVKQEIPAGEYAVKVTVPGVLAKHLTPSTKLGDDQHPFLNDWAQPEFFQNQNVLHAMTYKVVKKPGRSATLIALFQPRGLPLKDTLTLYPPGRNFQFLEQKLDGFLVQQDVPEADRDGIAEALYRGGKVIWIGRQKALRFWVVPGSPGYKWGGGDPEDVRKGQPAKAIELKPAPKKPEPARVKESVLKRLRGE
jgi:hypothetical protein